MLLVLHPKVYCHWLKEKKTNQPTKQANKQKKNHSQSIFILMEQCFLTESCSSGTHFVPIISYEEQVAPGQYYYNINRILLYCSNFFVYVSISEFGVLQGMSHYRNSGLKSSLTDVTERLHKNNVKLKKKKKGGEKRVKLKAM